MLRMVNRKRSPLRPVVIDSEVLDHPRLSPAALGVYVVIASARSGVSREALIARYGGNADLLEARLTQLKRLDLIEEAGR